MDDFIREPANERRAVFQATSTKRKLPPDLVEKDFWVCWVLKTLCNSFGKELTFRGGTSLSKAFHCIERFSEDIDVAMSQEWLGISEETDPAKAESNSQRTKRQKNLRKLGREAVTAKLEPLLKSALADVVRRDEEWNVEIEDIDARDPWVIYVNYPIAIAGESNYNPPRVKVELCPRAEGWPDEDVIIQAYAAEEFPNAIKENKVKVNTVIPARTFCEKAALIHEMNTAPESKGVAARLARHFYDLQQIIQSRHISKVTPELFASVMEHRNVYFGQTWINYEELRVETLQIAPEGKRLREWKTDYASMENMFFGQNPGFDHAVETICAYQASVSKSAKTKSSRKTGSLSGGLSFHPTKKKAKAKRSQSKLGFALGGHQHKKSDVPKRLIQAVIKIDHQLKRRAKPLEVAESIHSAQIERNGGTKVTYLSKTYTRDQWARLIAKCRKSDGYSGFWHG
tara:strand:+ start:7707 stop:9077 length:1371 start_codon:yes stop_codon:yes gene_type:complete